MAANGLMTIAAKARETSQNKAKSEGQTIKSRHLIALGMERNYPHKNKDNEEEEDKEDAEKTTGYQDTNRTVNVIFGGEGCLSRRVQKLMLREILVVELATPKYLK